MFMLLLDALLGQTRVRVSEKERVLALHKGRFVGILGPGEHRLPSRGGTLEIERHDLTKAQFVSGYDRALKRERPELVAEHFTELAAADDEVAVLFRDGAPFALSRSPRSRPLYWTAEGPWEIRRYPLDARLAVADELVDQVSGEGWSGLRYKEEVDAGQVGLLYVAGAFRGTLEPGVHLFWNVGRSVVVKRVDTRWRTHEVNGQEVLTADRVTIRVNVSAAYRVTDPVLAASAVKDFTEALHTALQLGFRRSLGTRTLDRMLAEKVTVDAEAANRVRREMVAIGIEVGEIALKDVILPGEMREILNRVVAAQKEAEANVIRRREETAATRSLLNTAKVMAQNPVMLRLKELEALTEVAGKVERLTVHNGTQGLLSDLVRLGD